MFEASSFHNAFFVSLVITRNSQHYHVNIVCSRKIYPGISSFVRETHAQNGRVCIICIMLFASGAITCYLPSCEGRGSSMLSALAKYVINRLIHGLFHIALVISPRLISSLRADIKVSC